MSETLQINKCIQSKLWYTSLTICQNDDRSSQVNNADFAEAKDLIVNLTDSQNVSQYEWIIHTLLRRLVNHVTSDGDYVRKEERFIQMKQALQLCRNLSTGLQEKLLTIYRDGTEQSSLELLRSIQVEYLTFLKQNIYDNPFVTCWIHNELLSTCSDASDDTIGQLQDFYSSLIRELLEFKLSKQKLIGDNSFECALLIISRISVSKFDEATWFTRLFPMMLKASDTQDLQLALYSRTDELLFKKWCAFLNEAHMNCKPINNLSDALKIQKVLFHFTPASVTINKNRLVERVNSIKSHWVIDILNICYVLMINGKYNDVSRILSCTLLKPLWPVLLLKVLNECLHWEDDLPDAWKHYDLLYNSIGFLIPKCSDLSQDSVFSELHSAMKKNLKILRYVLDCSKENEEKPIADSHRRISINWIFDLLQHFDTLSLLKMATNIHEQEHKRIRKLLEELREPENVYNAYYSILYALKAILLCDSYDANQSTIKDYLGNMRDVVKELHPLSLRVQVIENIFCLLFLRDEHFDHVPKSNDNSDIDTSYEQLKFDDKCKEHMAGFICNKYAVRDVLHHLRDIVSATRAEYMETKTENVEEIDRIDSAITDAKWRLELYTNPHFTEYAGQPVKDRSKTFRTKKLVINNSKEDVLPYLESSVSDEPKIKSNSSSGSGSTNNTKSRKHMRNLVLSDGTKDVIHKPLLVNFLLATKESLIIRCLWKNDYTKAQEILESSNMKNTQLNGEVEFSKALHAFRSNIPEQTSRLRSTNESQENAQSSALENIRQVIQEGIQSSRQTGQFETFLASQEVNLRMLSMKNLNNYEILTICALDMALTASQVYTVSLNLCEVAMKHLKLCKTFDNTEYVHFFHKFHQLLHEKKDEASVEDILCDAKVSLSVKEYKEKENFWTDVATKHQEFKESQVNENTIKKILPGLKILSKIATIPCGTKKYMQNLSSHLQLLHVIIPTEHALFTVSDLLKVPLHYYIGHQIFELEIEPSSLEPIAHDLQINLAYSILTSACPVLPYEDNTIFDTISKDVECIVLNKASNKSDLSYKIQEPNQCVSEILTELLQVLQNLNLNQSRLTRETCKILSEHANVRNVLSKTARLVSLDLSELSVGDETLTFLVNTWNLMLLHATLTVWANDPSFNDLQHSISLNSIGYLIGDLGLVTLITLRSKLLGDIISSDAFFIEVEELNEPAWQDLDITHDPRIIFLMANEYSETPSIKTYNTDSLNEDLVNAFRKYLDHYLVKRGENIIQLPEIVERYQNFISQNFEIDPSNNSNSIYSINEYIELNEATTIEYVPMSYSYSIILEYQRHPNTHHHKEVSTRYKTDWKIDNIRLSVLQYLVGQCWVVSYLLRRIQNESIPDLSNLNRTTCLENLVTSPWVKDLKALFEDNRTLAAILETIPMHRLWSHFEMIARNGEWESCLNIINALPSRVALRTEVQCFKDKVLGQIVTNKDTELNTEILRYLYQIKDVYTLSQTVLYNINKWHVNICKNVLLHLVHHVDNYKLPLHCVLKLMEILRRVLIFNEMLPYCIIKANETWYDVVYCTGKVDPLQIIKSLMNADQFELCLEWMECQAFSLEIHPFVTEEFLIGLLKSESQHFSQTSKFFQALPLDQSVKLCKVVLNKLESIDSLRFICNYLLQYCKATETIKYRKTLLGIEILSMLDARERSLYIHLIKEPLLMLEQLLMNCKFESIQRILNAIQSKLEQADISRSSFDKIIRFYAQKSLDIRVSLQCDAGDSKSLKNIQQSTSETENSEFVMPLYTPTKEEWVPNDKAKKCSCCKNVIFSMFNRRHHCRRCGRVICATCSQHRMQVFGYPPSVLVRVCDDCKRQTMLQAQTSQGTPSTSTFDYWRLTRDQKHNKTIREEFSFEYAPNISLCLAILNLHSEHKSYASFLLDCCDEMRRLLHPVAGGKVNPEVDHALIINMIRSLLVAAKVKCAKLGLNTGLSHCDSSLSQVDLIATLIQSDCLHLIPSDEVLDEKNHTLRKLRDRLIEKEQWTLALDMSTKAGLDTQGVWTTWGKACLKVGYFDQAREKFFHCLDKIQYDSFDDWVILSYPRESETSSNRGTQKLDKIEEEKLKRSEFSKNRPLKNPPVLTEILQILDNLSVYKQYAHYPHHSSTAQELLSNFGSFKITNRKQFNAKIYYQESLYYLLTYGSYTSILEFFLKHEEFDKCLAFTLENNLEPDLFFNGIYLYCLRNGNIEKLYEAMSSKDPSLFVWKKYLIHVCHSLEKRQYLNMLYHLQLFMKDSVRAAMTCVRFYTNEASSYTDLNAKANFLLDAQKHLESELQIESLNRKRKKSTSSMHGNQGILTMEMEPSEIDKHINTICRQMEIAKFLASCEKEGRAPIRYLSLFPGKDSNTPTTEVPTLFGNQQEKIDLAVLTILCGRNVEEGFGIAFRIMQDYNLPQQKVYSLAGHVLTVKNNVPAIQQLNICCQTSGVPNSYIISDYMLTHCVKLLMSRLNNHDEAVLKNDVYGLVRLITDIELKINAYIECKQLKAAYLLAVMHSRAQDVRKILKECGRLGQSAMEAICKTWLEQHSKLRVSYTKL